MIDTSFVIKPPSESKMLHLEITYGPYNMEETIESRHETSPVSMPFPKREIAFIGISATRKLNMGNYKRMQVSLLISSPSHISKLKENYRNLYKEAISLMNERIAFFKEQLAKGDIQELISKAQQNGGK